MTKTAPRILILVLIAFLGVSCIQTNKKPPSILPTPAQNTPTSVPDSPRHSRTPESAGDCRLADYRLYLPLITKPHPPPVYISPKKGVGFTTGACTARLTCHELQELHIAWGFTWGPGIPGHLSQCTTPNGDPIETVPMLWGLYAVKRPYPFTNANSDYLLTFNEPDMGGQANIRPEVAARAWYTIEQYSPHKNLIAPAPALRYIWLDKFVDAYVAQYNRLPRFDALAGHCYPGTLGHCQHVVEYLTDRLQPWNVTEGIWINEYAVFVPPTWNIDQYTHMIRTMEQTTTYLEQHPHVDRYAWWTTKYTGDEHWNGPAPWNPDHYDSRLLFCHAHELTLLGRAYANLNPTTATVPGTGATQPVPGTVAVVGFRFA